MLTALFLEAVLAANILGFGMNAIFSDTELRRYPLTALDRRLARHLTGIVDPFWFLFLALELGLAVGLYVLGAGSFWFGLIAVLLLFVSNYLLARVVGLFIDRLMQRKGGAADSARADPVAGHPAVHGDRAGPQEESRDHAGDRATPAIHAAVRRGRRDDPSRHGGGSTGSA